MLHLVSHLNRSFPSPSPHYCSIFMFPFFLYMSYLILLICYTKNIQNNQLRHTFNKLKLSPSCIYRHWQELGYLIIYVTGRPDMQQQKVVSWLAQHNFPHGLVSFADGLTRDPLAHKAEYLRGLIQVKNLILILGLFRI